jgi:hypothetical protein
MPIELEELEASAGGGARASFYGKYRGTVMNNMDPLQLGRIQAFVPEVLGPVPSGWAAPCVPVAGFGAGFLSLPFVGAGVWIEFEAGDISRPIWTGGYWAAGETPFPPPAPVPPLPTTKIWRSDTGHSVVMDDLLQTLTLSDPLGTNSVTIDVKTATVTVKGLARVVLEAPVVQEGSGFATSPAVKGDQLMAYLAQLVTLFNTHVHPGELAGGFLPVTPAPPVAPFPPPPPPLVSVKVFLE